MKITVLSLFPELVNTMCNESILKRAQQKNCVEIDYVQLRDYSVDKHGTVDDRPYGGAAGMVIRIEPVVEALESSGVAKGTAHVVLTSARGVAFNQKKARELAQKEHLVIIAGHYESVDDRVQDYIDEEISIGDYVLTGGELPACVMIDSVVRLLPGVLRKDQATEEESFSELPLDDVISAVGMTKQLETLKNNAIQTVRLLEYPHFTRPPEFRGKKVPDILLSGDHAAIRRWQIQKAYELTLKRRPDLLS